MKRLTVMISREKKYVELYQSPDIFTSPPKLHKITTLFAGGLIILLCEAPI